MRILILGWPGVGKSTLAKQLAKDKVVRHLCTDPQRLCDSGVEGVSDALDWSAASQWVCDNWIGKENTVIEGVGVVRALRKWREKNPGKPIPADQIIHLKEPHKPLDSRQVGMGKGHDKVFSEIADWCRR